MPRFAPPRPRLPRLPVPLTFGDRGAGVRATSCVMSDQRLTGVRTAPDHEPADRLDSWKEIASFLKRDVKTVQRWERREGMPVHRHVHEKLGSV